MLKKYSVFGYSGVAIYFITLIPLYIGTLPHNFNGIIFFFICPICRLFQSNKMDPLENPRSLNSLEKCYIRFVNLTNRTIDVIWIDYTGRYIQYKRLNPRVYLDIDTFKTHPWIAIDSNTKDRLHINGEVVYYPHGYQQNSRIMIMVTIPLYCLRYRALLKVRSFFKNPEEVERLDMPRVIVDDLKQSIEERNNMPWGVRREASVTNGGGA